MEMGAPASCSEGCLMIHKCVPCPSVGSGLGDQVHGNPQIPGIGGRILDSATRCDPATPMQQVRWWLLELLPGACLGFLPLGLQGEHGIEVSVEPGWVS